MTTRSRYAPIALVVGLLAATAVAFVVTERLKLTPAPIRGPIEVTKVFSPDCECDTDTATISFVLRRPDVIGIDVVDSHDRLVRELVRRSSRRGRVTVYWNGRIESGAPAVEGTYRPRVHLARNKRTILMPNRIVVDVTPPQGEARARPPVGDLTRRGRAGGSSRRSSTGPTRPRRSSLYVDGIRRTLKRGTRSRGTIEWDGRIDGSAVPPGRYRITIGATDVAGNVSAPSRGVEVLVRYVALGRRFFRVAPKGTVAVTVRADAESFRWRLGNRSGTGRTGLFRVTAPRRPGRYALVVTVHGHGARATVVVRPPKKKRATP